MADVFKIAIGVFTALLVRAAVMGAVEAYRHRQASPRPWWYRWLDQMRMCG